MASEQSVTSSNSFLVTLRRELGRALVPEMELTLKVAVLSAAGRSRAQIVNQLAVPELEVKMALLRLQRVAETWT